MDSATIAAHDRPVPRYTSYPTAAQFDRSVGPAQHTAWLAGLNMGTAAFYLHVPFCERLCFYCACHTTAMRRDDTLEGYARALLRELERVSTVAPGVIVESVQWGGGTPSQLGPARLVTVGHRLASLFDMRSGREMSMEVDPRFCDATLVEAMVALGVTRVSLGVQDFDIGVQRAINRRQSPELTAAAIARLRDAGIRHCNLDLVYGLPRQTLDTLSLTLDKAIALQPDRVAVFGYAHVPWMKPRQALIDAESLPGAEVRAAMADLVADRLVGAGYVRIGLDHYARPGDALARAAALRKLRRNFQGYVADETPWVVGIGASAISCLPQGFSQNATSTVAYLAAIEQGTFATSRGIAWSDEDRLRGDVINALMCHFEADLDEICRRHGASVTQLLTSIPELSPLICDGLTCVDGTRLLITERGRPLVRSVCAAFDRYYTGAESRHARGV
jgi:oxygen-independent coproporphyrinogen III oxidase